MSIPKEREKWNPTPDQFDRYLNREIELAMLNIQKFGHSMLSSEKTSIEARHRLKENRGWA